MLTGYDFNRIELFLPNASLIFRFAEGKRRNFLNASPQIPWAENDGESERSVSHRAVQAVAR